MKKTYKRTAHKVEVTNGTQKFTRAVYTDDEGTRYFKHNGEMCEIYRRGDIFKAPWFTRVEFIA